MRKEDTPTPRNSHTAREAFEDKKAQVLLQRGHVMAQCWLSHVQFP